MFKSRKLTPSRYRDQQGIKIYDISADGHYADQSVFVERLEQLKFDKAIDWSNTAAFALFHRGESMHYLVLCWWGNDNELFTSVSVLTVDGWLEDPARYSFCLYDMEVMWAERNFYIETVDCPRPSLESYRNLYF